MRKGGRVLCLAGYVIQPRFAAEMCEEWIGVLRARGLPYFHMVDCAHGNGAFNISLGDRIQIQCRMIQIIEKYTEYGVALTIDLDAHDRVPSHPAIGSAYTMAAGMMLNVIAFLLDHQPDVDSAAYFFEAGHASQSEANALMQRIFKDPHQRRRYRYARHAFVPKEKSPLVQAADLLAWQWATDRRHEKEGKLRRKDCARLIRHKHFVSHLGAAVFDPLLEAIRADDLRTLIQAAETSPALAPLLVAKN